MYRFTERPFNEKIINKPRAITFPLFDHIKYVLREVSTNKRASVSGQKCNQRGEAREREG